MVRLPVKWTTCDLWHDAPDTINVLCTLSFCNHQSFTYSWTTLLTRYLCHPHGLSEIVSVIWLFLLSGCVVAYLSVKNKFQSSSSLGQAERRMHVYKYFSRHYVAQELNWFSDILWNDNYITVYFTCLYCSIIPNLNDFACW